MLELSIRLANCRSCEITLLAFWFCASKPEHNAIQLRPPCFAVAELMSSKLRPAQVIDTSMPVSVDPNGRNFIFCRVRRYLRFLS